MQDISDEIESSDSKSKSGWNVLGAAIQALKERQLEAEKKEKERLHELKVEAKRRAWLLSGGTLAFASSFIAWFISTFAPGALQTLSESRVALYSVPMMIASMVLMLKAVIDSKGVMSLKEVDDLSISKKKRTKKESDQYIPNPVDKNSNTLTPNAQDQLISEAGDVSDLAEMMIANRASVGVGVSATDSFEVYVREIIVSLDTQVEWMERKGSNLLDRGRASLRNGIYFYVVSIVIWQLYAWASKSVTDIMIYGIVSCSLAFIVMEFSAAWFLREYRAYVAASSHLEKVKSLYNRYLLSYLGIKAFASDDGAGLAKMRSELLKTLAQDVSWPEAGKGKSNDFNHMVEMLDSLSGFVSKAKGVIAPLPRKRAKSDVEASE
ncbi:hypothetical protein [Pseudomonas viridiflava]|uniref:hypothetical protein n=1 Tax=Pseudomonas viridiflava TaxID=33069 RepID=UPI00106FED8C|nr:hypothetical protein [Pseudomonas viridiflava]MEE4225624.1 hypothetical protein [Pseudomonas viridiflava]QXG36218.1 hypothetical protein KTT61_03100 [Pseudomonas viridiflava]QXG39362.1 hypothetical protein KTT55_18560 [Pseudomonas viridiflava]